MPDPNENPVAVVVAGGTLPNPPKENEVFGAVPAAVIVVPLPNPSPKPVLVDVVGAPKPPKEKLGAVVAVVLPNPPKEKLGVVVTVELPNPPNPPIKRNPKDNVSLNHFNKAQLKVQNLQLVLLDRMVQ